MIITYGCDFEVMNFPAGEGHVKLKNLKEYPDFVNQPMIVWNFENQGELFTVLQMANVLQNKGLHFSMICRYLPFARQDRATSEEQPFSLKIFADVLNTIENCISLHVCDLHSEVFKNLYKGTIYEYTQKECFLAAMSRRKVVPDWAAVVAPDKGAWGKTHDIAKFLHRPVIHCTKKRDPDTGQLSSPEFLAEDVLPELKEGQRLIIVDDICDGGYTFLQLAELIKGKYPNNPLDLYVTHGVFSKGIEVLYQKFDDIYCFNNMNKEVDL